MCNVTVKKKVVDCMSKRKVNDNDDNDYIMCVIM